MTPATAAFVHEQQEWLDAFLIRVRQEEAEYRARGPQRNLELEAQARRTAAYIVKCRARVYRQRPMLLERLAPHLCCANGDRLIAWGEHLLGYERAHPQRWFGFGGEVRSINAKACILLGRYQRMFEDRERRAA